MINKFAIFLVGIIIGVFINFGFVTKEKEYVYVDIEKVVSEIASNIKETNAENASNKILEQKQKFESALIDYQKRHNALIFSSPKPIKGAVDKTNYFIKKLV